MAELAPNQNPNYREQFSRVSSVRVLERQYRDPRNAGTARKVGGAGLRVTGTGIQVAGKATKTTGKVVMRGGAALSSTGVGALVGIPMAAAGGVLVAGGTIVDKTGKVVKRAGKVVSKQEQTQPLVLVPGIKRRPFGRKKRVLKAAVGGFLVKTFILRAVFWFMVTWLWLFQIVLTFIVIYGFSFIAGTASPLPSQSGDESGGIRGFFTGIYNAVATSVAEFAAQSIAVPAVLMAWGLCMLICTFVLFVTLMGLLMTTWSGGSNIKPLNTATKEMLFLVAIIGYSLPLLQIIPWGAFWVWHLLRHGADSE